jgi:hypothetical protein
VISEVDWNWLSTMANGSIWTIVFAWPQTWFPFMPMWFGRWFQTIPTKGRLHVNEGCKSIQLDRRQLNEETYSCANFLLIAIKSYTNPDKTCHDGLGQTRYFVQLRVLKGFGPSAALTEWKGHSWPFMVPPVHRNRFHLCAAVMLASCFQLNKPPVWHRTLQEPNVSN